MVSVMADKIQMKTQCKLCCLVQQEVISLSEGSTVDLRKPGEDEEEYSEMGEDVMDPEECFPECKQIKHETRLYIIFVLL